MSVSLVGAQLGCRQGCHGNLSWVVGVCCALARADLFLALGDGEDMGFASDLVTEGAELPRRIRCGLRAQVGLGKLGCPDGQVVGFARALVRAGLMFTSPP